MRAMPTLKTFIKHPRTQQVIAFICAWYIRLVVATSKIERRIDPGAERFMRSEENAIFAFWHGRMMVLPCFHPPKRQMHVLISGHGDGVLISKVIAHFDKKTVTGSSSKGGSEAVRHILRLIKAGDNVSITPDGPRGPAHVAQMGVVTLAALSKKPVLPVTYFATRHKRLGSWDKFMVALPFSRIIFAVGAPIAIEKADEESRILIERAMNELVEKNSAL
jgi:lysophospholipid acyltransferase (LPLAT)-like uncharacterized protein